MDACNVDCRIIPDTDDNQPRNLTMIAYEFAPFANSKEYCLYINNLQKPSQCSGEKNFQVRHGPYESSKGWTFKMTLNDSVKNVPKLRFWVSLSSKHFNHILMQYIYEINIFSLIEPIYLFLQFIS